MTRWPRRLGPDPGWPAPLQEFREQDWQVWTLPGPDPAAEAFADGDLERFYRVHAHRPPAWHQAHRRLDAHCRWLEARVTRLKAEGLPWLDTWIDGVSFEHRVLRADLRAIYAAHPGDSRGLRPALHWTNGPPEET